MTTILAATRDPNLFAPWFKNRATWAAWFAFLAALFGLPMTAEQLAIFKECTGRDSAPTRPAKEGWLIVGRRGGKSFVLALLAVFLACFFDYTPYLAPGERGTIMIIARDRQQSRIILRYIGALLRVPLLAQLIVRETTEAFDLDNAVTIEVHTASFRSTRGYAIIAALCDELAFWPSDNSAEPDYEVINALKPGMAQFPGALLLCASSPYARRGALWTAHRKHFGQPGDPVLIWQAATRRMNPAVPQSFIDAEIERDPANAAAEFGAQFRTDIEAFISREAIEAVVSVGLRERPRFPGIGYSAFTDPSGGSADSWTLAIAHQSDDKIAVLDCVREIKPPFSPEAVAAEYAMLLKSYGITKIIGDRYAGIFPVELFRQRGITYEQAAKPKSDLYRETLPLINSRKCDLLDHPRLTAQLLGLERRTARSGKDSIDHAPNGHDDIANAVAGVLTNLTTKKYAYDVTMAWVMGDNAAKDDEEWRAGRLSQHLLNRGMFR
jgi:hypothetical protein